MDHSFFFNLNKATLVNKEGFVYSDFRKTLTPKWIVVWTHITLAWITLILLNLITLKLSGYYLATDLLLIGSGAIFIGFNIAYLQLFIHEAAHYNIHPNKVTNDYLCNLFISGIVGMDIRHYRPIHWSHHQHLGTPLDTETSYFQPLNSQFIIEALLGIHAIKVICSRKKQKSDTKTGKTITKPSYILLAGLLTNILYLLVLFSFNQWILFFAWLGGLLIFFPFFGAIRQLLEHRSEMAKTTEDYTKIMHGEVHRLFDDSVMGRTLGGAGFNRHLLHHWSPQISYTRLAELETYLMQTKYKTYLQEHKTSYTQTFNKLFTWAKE